MNRPEYLIIHHSGGTDADPLADTSKHSFETVDNWHRRLWQFKSSLGHYIGYHYFIDRSGKVTQGRADNEEGAHCLGKNKSSIGICISGNFDRTSPKPSKAQEDALRKLLLQLMNRHGITADKIVPHREFSNKTCYGRTLPDDWARNLVESESPMSLQEYTTMQLINELRRRIATGEL